MERPWWLRPCSFVVAALVVAGASSGLARHLSPPPGLPGRGAVVLSFEEDRVRVRLPGCSGASFGLPPDGHDTRGALWVPLYHLLRESRYRAGGRSLAWILVHDPEARPDFDDLRWLASTLVAAGVPKLALSETPDRPPVRAWVPELQPLAPPAPAYLSASLHPPVLALDRFGPADHVLVHGRVAVVPREPPDHVYARLLDLRVQETTPPRSRTVTLGTGSTCWLAALGGPGEPAEELARALGRFELAEQVDFGVLAVDGHVPVRRVIEAMRGMERAGLERAVLTSRWFADAPDCAGRLTSGEELRCVLAAVEADLRERPFAPRLPSRARRQPRTPPGIIACPVDRSHRPNWQLGRLSPEQLRADGRSRGPLDAVTMQRIRDALLQSTLPSAGISSPAWGDGAHLSARPTASPDGLPRSPSGASAP